MPCGCKGNKTIRPAQQPSRITYTENGNTPSPSSEPVPSPSHEVENIVEKLNDIGHQ